MQPERKAEVTVAISVPASPHPQAVTVPTAAVPLEWLRQYASPKPLRRGPTPSGQPHTGKDTAD
jgi:hypothetical protein